LSLSKIVRSKVKAALSKKKDDNLMKVLLVSANTLTSPYPVYPIGLDYVSRAISPNHQVEIADLNLFKDVHAIKSVIHDYRPDIIGLSIRNIDNTDITDPKSFINQYLHIANIIRNFSNAPLVLGGSGFTIFADELMSALKADYGIVGEGERLSLLLDALEKNGNLSGIPGLLIQGSKKVMPDPWNNSFQRIFKTDSSHLDYYLKKGGMLNVQTKRGCSFKCVYCTYPHIEGNKLRLAPPHEIAETVVQFQKAGAKYFFVTDSAFNVDYPHSIQVAEAFKKAGVSIPWGAFFAPTVPPEDYYKILADSGLTHVEFGTESLCDRVLFNYRKPFKVADIFRSHQRAIDAGLYVAHYFLLGGPGETFDSVAETLSNIGKLNKTVLFIFCGMRIYPHTALFEIALKEGLVKRPQTLLEPAFYRSSAIGMEDIVDLVKKKAESRPNWIFGAGGDKTEQTISKMYDRGFSGPLWEYLIC
jgi:radical SAM superfamily enzyme YgiQ (UPF0313 family)